jgi:segregation and condensation protein B
MGTDPTSDEPVTPADEDAAAGERLERGAGDHVGRLAQIVESLLFASGTPVSLKRLTDILAGPSTRQVQTALAHLKAQYAPGHRGIQLHEVAGGYQFRTARENAEWVRAVFRDKPARLGRAALETLAIVAYKQPVTKAEIEAVRGVDVDGVLTTLLGRKLIKIAGRKDTIGRPLLYTTTPEFLETFGLRDLKDLPSLKELGPALDAEEATSIAPSHAATPAADATEPVAQATGSAASDSVLAAGSLATTPPGTPAEAVEPGGRHLAPEGRGDDSAGAGAGERAGGDDAGDAGGPTDRSGHR